MGGTTKQTGNKSTWSSSHVPYGHPRYHIRSVPAQKNITKATYQTPVHPQFQPSFKHGRPTGNVDVRNFPLIGTVANYNYNSENYSYSVLQASHGQLWYEPFIASYPHFDGSSSSAIMGTSPPRPSSDFTVSSQGYDSSANHGSLQTGLNHHALSPSVMSPGVLPVAGLSIPHVFSPAHLLPPSPYTAMNDSRHLSPYVVVHTSVPETGYVSTNESVFLGDASNTYSSVSNGFHHETADKTYSQSASSAVTYPQIPHINVLDTGSQRTHGDSFPSHSYSQLRSNKLLHRKVDPNTTAIREAAYSFVDLFCPLLGERPYCVPPVRRSRHPDKSIKQLVLGMESEKRVLGSFERFFAETQVPAFMLCHYPMTGFMQVYSSESSDTDREPKPTGGKNDKGNLTLLLLSDVFSVTIVTVSIISSNSDFTYIQRGVHKAVAHMKRCSTVLTHWLSFLGVAPEVKQVIAFPNLKRAMMQRIAKDKSYGSLCTLHVDDLSSPFEEEWSTDEHKVHFMDWMQKNITCHAPTLSRDDLHLVVGALLSPRLSRVDFIHDLSQMSPLSSASAGCADVSDEALEDVSQLKLTVDGVMKPFDEFMDEYVSAYYPDVEERTYRVPPIHFNIQSFKKPVEYLQHSRDPLAKGTSSVTGDVRSTTQESDLGEEGSNKCGDGDHSEKINSAVVNSDFMPAYYQYRMTADKINDGANLVGPEKLEMPRCENGHDGRLKMTKSFVAGMGHAKKPLISKQKTTLKAQVSTKNGQMSKSRGFETSNRLSSGMSSSSSHSPSPPSDNRKKHSDELPSQYKPKPDPRLEALQDVEVLSEVMTKDIRADEGENRVINALEKLGLEFGPMFIICDYQYNNYLNKLREEMFPKGEVKRPVRAFGQTMRAEHDCLIFHKKFGAIVVCIKAIGDNFMDWGASEEQKIVSTNKILEKAMKQLEREEAMIRHVTSDLHPKLACHKLIALPNLTREDVVRALETDSELLKKIKETLGYGAELFLCSDELPPKFQSFYSSEGHSSWNKLVHWWERVQKQIMEGESGMTVRMFRQVIGRYCGLLSTVEVWSPNIPRVEVRSLSEAVRVCAQRFSKIVLLPCQVEALCASERRMFLYGPPGSGKTLLLILKAKEWLLAGENVVIINSRTGSSHGYPYAFGVFNRLQEMMIQAKVQKYNLFMIRINSLQFRASDLAGVMPSCCIIMDEVTAASHQIIEHLCCLQVKNVWCAGLFEDDKPITAHGFATRKMDKIIRCPPVIQSIMKLTEREVKLNTPYKDIYEGSGLGKKCQVTDKLNTFSAGDDDDKKADRVNTQSINIYDFELKRDCVLSTVKASELTDIQVDRRESGRISSYVPDTRQVKEIFSEQPDSNTETNTEDLQYDPDSLNRRLAEKYGRKPQKTEEHKSIRPRLSFDPSYYSTSSAEVGLPTDGPWPHIIDHSCHSRPGSPMDCSECGQKLAEFLYTMVRPEGFPTSHKKQQQQQQGLGKNKHAFKNSRLTGSRAQSSKTDDGPLSTTAYAPTQPAAAASGQQLGVFFDNRALTWSDVLVVGREITKNCPFVTSLKSRNIPVEVVTSGHTSQIEDSRERKLFITSYKEVTGLERAVIVFVPSHGPCSLQQTDSTTDVLDLHLRYNISRYSNEDKIVLWHVASRSLGSLVLILP